MSNEADLSTMIAHVEVEIRPSIEFSWVIACMLDAERSGCGIQTAHRAATAPSVRGYNPNHS